MSATLPRTEREWAAWTIERNAQAVVSQAMVNIMAEMTTDEFQAVLDDMTLEEVQSLQEMIAIHEANAEE